MGLPEGCLSLPQPLKMLRFCATSDSDFLTHVQCLGLNIVVRGLRVEGGEGKFRMGKREELKN